MSKHGQGDTPMSASLSDIPTTEHYHNMQGDLGDEIKTEKVASITYRYRDAHCTCGEQSGKSIVGTVATETSTE